MGGGLNIQWIKYYSNSIIWIINYLLVPLLIAVAFIVFLYGVFLYFIKGGASEDAQKEGRQYVMYGVIGFVIIFSLWGLVNIVTGTLGVGGQSSPPPPIFGTGGSTAGQPATSPFGQNPNNQCSIGADGASCTINGGPGQCLNGQCVSTFTP